MCCLTPPLEITVSTSRPVGATPKARSSGAGAFGDVLRNNVMEILRSAPPDSKQGTAIAELVNTLPDFAEEDIRQAVAFLINEGHIYTTIDDHVKCVN